MSSEAAFAIDENSVLIQFSNGISLPLHEWIKSQNDLKTPCYVYNLDHIRSRAQFLKSTLQSKLGRLPSIHYAVKANHRDSVLRVLRAEGIQVDVVSSGEIEASYRAGFAANQVLFSGVGKTVQELEYAIGTDAGSKKTVKQINVESLGELERLIRLIEKRDPKLEPVSLGLRFNPNVSPETHPYITTGLKENKFGLEENGIREAVELIKKSASAQRSLRLRGLSLHIGSQLLDLAPLDEAIAKAMDLQDELSQKVHSALPWDRFDAGGGIGINYRSFDESLERAAIAELGDILSRRLKKKLDDGVLSDVMIEPGRWLVARAGALLTEVQYVKANAHKKFVIVDGGMNMLLRPALYEAEHRISAVEGLNRRNEIVDIVGPICESSDVLGRDRTLTTVAEGEKVIVFDAGAYGASMSSNYNLRGWPPREYDISLPTPAAED